MANTDKTITPFKLGSMSDIVYSVGGGMEDWAYAAGFDTGPDAGFNNCFPRTLPELKNTFFES